MRRPLVPPNIAPPAANYAHGILGEGVDEIVHTSGVVPIAPDGSVPESIADQADVVWGNLAAILAEAGMDATCIVSITTYVVLGHDLAPVMAARDRHLEGRLAASTLVYVPALAQDAWKVEVAIVASKEREAVEMSNEARNRQTVERYWDAHFRRDWDAMAGFFDARAHYTDVGLDGVGATGPEEIIARLRLGIEPLEGYYHFPKHVVAEGDLVVTEHVEQWRFHTGEVVDHPFTSVMEVRDGSIVRWHDYSHLGNLLDNAPAWWLEHIAKGFR